MSEFELVEVPQSSLDYAQTLDAKTEIHSEDFIYHYVSRKLKPPQSTNEYFKLGRYSADLVAAIAKEYGEVSAYTNSGWKPNRVLDFASGYGCVTRHLVHAFPQSKIIASDIHEQANAFIRKMLSVDTFQSTSSPGNFPSDQIKFDLIIALSFFSHMPKRTFAQWLDTISGLLAPNGLFIFTTHGRVSHTKVIPHMTLAEPDFGFASRSEQGDLNADEYGTTISYCNFVLRLMDERPNLALFKFREGFWWRHQDVFAIRRV